MITPPRSGGSGLTGKSGRKTANVCDASTREMNINTAANFMLVAFIKINRLSSFFYEICRPKFSKLQSLYVGALLIDVQRHHRTAYSLVLFVGSPYVFPLCVVIHISRGCYVYYSHRIVGELSEQFTIRASLKNACELVLTKIAPI